MKPVQAKVVTIYAGRRPGESITVDEKEYLRLREPILNDQGKRTGWRFPVLINEADEAVMIKAEIAARTAVASEASSDTSESWRKMEELSLSTVRTSWARRIQAENADSAAAVTEILKTADGKG